MKPTPKPRATPPDDVRVVQPLGPEHAPALLELFRAEWWTRDRALADVERLLATNRHCFGLVDREGRLRGFSRVVTDGVFKALVLDVIVDRERRGQGEGKLLMETLLAHPELRDVKHFELYCLPELIPFYERWAFSPELGELRFLRRS
jgi:GNAT superfamily N-acetyltransferase